MSQNVANLPVRNQQSKEPERKLSELSIYERLFLVTKRCDQIEKKGYNDHGKYYYVRAVDVIKEVKKLLVEFGVGLTIQEEGIERKEVGKNIHCEIRSRATFFCISKPEDKKEVIYYSASSDRLDKDIFKAKTNGLKYLFIQEFLIETDDGLMDTENDARPEQDENYQERPGNLPKKKKQKPQYYNKKTSQNKRVSYKQMNYIEILQDRLALGEQGYTRAELSEFSAKQASEVIEHYKRQLGEQ